jgi:hypothetical protein
VLTPQGAAMMANFLHVAGGVREPPCGPAPHPMGGED